MAKPGHTTAVSSASLIRKAKANSAMTTAKTRKTPAAAPTPAPRASVLALLGDLGLG